MNKFNSESGKYCLVVEQINNGKFLNHSLGKIYQNDNLLFEVKRNYCAFPFLFVENYNGHDYLICGEDYQGQTILELDTNKKINYMSEGADKGFGFCWADFKLDLKSKILVVDGCIWSAPYEYRFYDFSDPMNSLRELKIIDDCVFYSSKEPIIENNIIKTFEIKEKYDYEYDGEDIPESLPEVINSIKTFEIKNNSLILNNEWISEDEKSRRERRKKEQDEYDEKQRNFKANDPLYLKYKELSKDLLNKEEYCSYGITYKGWCPDFTGEETRYCHRIYKNFNNYDIDLEWGIYSAPIKLIIYKNFKKLEEKFFEHNTNGIEQAFEYCKNLING
jgi:hypothetical protein